MKRVLTIAGSDSSGGAGIQADIKTMIMNGVYAMSAITALTAQNTTGVTRVEEVSERFLGEQLDAVFTDIMPDAIKIGMVPSGGLIDEIVRRLGEYSAKNIVVDPVMIATSGAKLIKSEAVCSLADKLFPVAKIITPNIPEAEALCMTKISCKEDMCRAAQSLNRTYKCAVLLKGGHSMENADDLLCIDNEFIWIYGERINNPNTHGTGCTLSSAIASNLAKGFSLFDSVKRAKEYITGALSYGLNLGKGSGPLNHCFCYGGKFTENCL